MAEKGKAEEEAPLLGDNKPNKYGSDEDKDIESSGSNSTMPPSSVSSKNGASLTSSTSTGSPTSTGSSTTTGPSVVNLDATVENLPPGEQAVDEEPAPAQPVIVPVVPVIVPEPQPVIPEAIIRQYGDNVAISKCPVIGSCLQCCSRKVFNHRIKCAVVGFIITLAFLAVSIGCLAVVVIYPKLTEEGQSSNLSVYLAPLSVIEVDLKKYGIDTLKEHKLNITSGHNDEKYEGSIEVTVGHGVKCIPTDTHMNFPRKNLTDKSLLRYWAHEPKGDISLTPEHDYIIWTWGNLTHHPPHHNCSKNTSNWGKGTVDVTKIYGSRTSDDKLVLISFCTKNGHEKSEAKINITECLPAPDITGYRPIYCNNKNSSRPRDSTTVEFQSIPSEILHSSKLYVNTLHLYTLHQDYDEVEIELRALPNSEVRLLAIVGMSLSLILTLLSLLITIAVCCCCKDKEYISCGCFYHNM